MYRRFSFSFSTHHHPEKLGWASIAPFFLLLAYAALSFPMMYPGFDIWVHIVSINSNGDVWQTPWHTFWRLFFNLFSVVNPFDQAKIIHTIQIISTGGLVWLGGRWILKLVFSNAYVNHNLLNFAAWIGVATWFLMHGTVSSAIYSDVSVWYSWLLWYSVNYQITLPMYVLATGAFLYGCFGQTVANTKLTRWPYFLISATSIYLIAIVHAGELPYVLFSLISIGLLWFRWRWRWYYLAGALVCIAVFTLGITYSYRLPTGIIILKEQGFSGLIETVATSGQLLVGGVNRGNSSWNYWYWVNLFLVFSVFISLFYIRSKTDKKLNMRAVGFIALSSLPAAMLHWKWTAGLLAMVTYPDLASRFSFSTFLFLSFPLALLAVSIYRPKSAREPFLGVSTCAFIVGVLLLSYYTETNKVSYKYAHSLALALSPERMSFGLTPAQTAWLNQTHAALIQTPPSEPICTDIFTAYYLYFIKGYDKVVLPNRVNWDIEPNRRASEASCTFPNDGGDIHKVNIEPIPWAVN